MTAIGERGIETRGVGVIQTVASLRMEAGGTTRAVVGLCSALRRLGVDVEVVTSDGSASVGDEVGSLGPLKGAALWRPVGSRPWAGGIFARALENRLDVLGKNRRDVIIHDNGIWLFNNHVASSLARRRGVASIVTLHGMLSGWALRHRAWKKRFAWRLYQARDLRGARLLHATAEQEAEDLREIGLRQPIAVIPNGVELPAGPAIKRRCRGCRKALFLSRIHPVKGLLNLVEAWLLVRPPGWRLVIAGPDENGHRAVVEARIRDAGLAGECEFIGPVVGEHKAAVYRGADLFILPSFTENFGVVVAEALAHELPVIATRGSPWADLEAFGCGWWVETGVSPLAEALRAATALSDDERAVMGERGRAYVQRYNWDAIAAEMVAVYLWVLGRGERPSCVHLD